MLSAVRPAELVKMLAPCTHGRSRGGYMKVAMVRIDPDKVLKSEVQSQDYLSKPAKRGD